jgi:hypothetical protein
MRSFETAWSDLRDRQSGLHRDWRIERRLDPSDLEQDREVDKRRRQRLLPDEIGSAESIAQAC